MKSIFFLFSVLLTTITWSNPRVFLNYKTYYTISNKPYIETAIQFSSATIKFIPNQNGNLQANIEVTQVFKRDDKIIVVDKYKLSSPEMIDSTVEDFFDVKRFLLDSGLYEFEITIKDLNADQTISQSFVIHLAGLDESNVIISDINYIQNLSKSTQKDNFTKNGYRLIPYFTNYFPPDYDKIVYYLELYNTELYFNPEEVFAATFQVINKENGTLVDELFQYKKLKSSAIIPIINVLNIKDLPTGTYELIVQIMNSDQDVLSDKKYIFKRRNNIVIDHIINPSRIDITKDFAKEVANDSIFYNIGSLMPICTHGEYEQIRKMYLNYDTLRMRNFFYDFWKKMAPIDTYTEWMKYKQQVKYAQHLFGTQIRAGYETDRGRIHLKYGSPNSITDQPVGSSAYPYQIWHYYKVGQQSDVRFVFYNPDLITNDYPLLHSDLQGEIKNSNWRHAILKRNNSNSDLQQRNNGNSGIYFEN